jgi:hypothetical protein
MTLVAVWQAGPRIQAVADTRLIRETGNILTEHGPKLLPLVVSCRQPGPSGEFDREVSRTTVGFAYSGSTLTALSTHALATTLFGNLIAVPNTPPPALEEIAVAISGIATRYIREVGVLTGPSAFFDAIIFGQCPRTATLRAFQLQGVLQDRPEMLVNEFDLRPRGAVAIIGTNQRLFRELILTRRQQAEADVIFDDAPTRALQEIIATGRDDRVGGTIQQAWAAAGQFFPVMNAVPVAAPDGARNITFHVLGYDLDGDQFSVGGYTAGLFARF